MKNANVKNKLNKCDLIVDAETVEAVKRESYILVIKSMVLFSILTPTVYCHLENKSNIKNRENINKDRTIIFFNIMGLSLCVLMYRAGPTGNTI